MPEPTERVPLTKLEGRILPGYAVPVFNWHRAADTEDGSPRFIWWRSEHDSVGFFDVDLETATVEVKRRPTIYTRIETVEAIRNTDEDRDLLRARLGHLSPRDVWFDGSTACYRPGDHTDRILPGQWAVFHEDGVIDILSDAEFQSTYTAAPS